MSDLRKKLIRLAKQHPEARSGLLPILKEASKGDLIATNSAFYQWEYTYISITAKIYEKNDRLSLVIHQLNENSGLNPHKVDKILEDVDLGPLSKPNLRLAQSLLKKHNFQRSSAARGFKREWRDQHGTDFALGKIIKDHQVYKNSMSRVRSNQKALDEKKRREIMEKIQGMSGGELDKLLGLL